ncbi:tripartite tricarboxylate transporter permease [Chloroflexota bacterium]
MFEEVFSGLAAIFQPTVLLFMLMGIGLGLLFGLLPGISGVTGLAILIPLIYGMEPQLALAFLMAMYAVCYTGGSVTAILFNIPGTGPNAATLLDGFPMTQKGHAGRALGNALTASGLGGLVGAVALALLIPAIRPVVMAFAAPESLFLAILGISFIAALGSGSMVKGLIAGGLGITIAFVGTQPTSGIPRYAFGTAYLLDGIPLIPLALGLFAVPTVIRLINTGGAMAQVSSRASTTTSDIIQGIKDVFIKWWLFLRCSVIGTLVGIVPGVGGETAIWIAYGHAKQTSKYPERFGTGFEEGVIAPESCNNAKEGGGLMPTLAFGIPGSAAMAVLLGAFLILGIQPGPMFLQEHLDIAFTLVGSLVFANIIGAAICLVGAPWLSKVAFIRGHLLAPLMLLFISVGAYAVRGNIVDVVLAFGLGALGIAMDRYGFSKPALFIGYVLGGLAERYFYISYSAYSWTFLLRPITLGIIAIIVLGLSSGPIGNLLRRLRRR